MPASATRALKMQFDDIAQQREADTLGMWVFLSTEILLFGGLFLAYAVCRTLHPAAWAAGAEEQHLLLGTFNTAILLVSSLTMALAVRAAEGGVRKTATTFLGLTVILGACFLAIKFYEYYLHYQAGALPGPLFRATHPGQPFEELYFVFYYAMTGLHATHMLIGLGIVSMLAVQVWRGRLHDHMPVEITGLYWHLIDVIWVFLYPLLYLVR